MAQTETTGRTILNQLGGYRFITMTGARSLVDTGDGLMFQLPERFARAGINKIVVTLNANDYYDLQAWRIKGVDCRLIEERTNVPAETLRETFTRLTGLDTSL